MNDRIPIRHDADKGRPLARSSTRHVADNGRSSGRSGSTVGSTKSEALQALRQELEDIKGQLRQKNNTPRSDLRPSSDQRTRLGQHSTPLRDSLCETLRSQFIPQPSPVADVYSKSSLPHWTHSTPYRGPHRTELPPKLHVSDLDASPVRGGSPYSRTGGVPYRESHPEPCPLCGGSGSHTHSQYQSGSPPSQPIPMQPLPQPAMQPIPSQPTPMQQPPQPAMHSYPQSPPAPHGYSYVPMTTSTPSMQPMPSQSYTAAPLVTPISYQQSQPQSVSGNGMHHFQPGGVPVNGMYQSQPAGGEPQHQVTTHAHPQPATHIRDDATPAVVYVTPARRKGRCYARDEDSSSSSHEDDQVELYYRRTPRVSTIRSPRSSRYGSSILHKASHKGVSFDDDDGMDKSLDSALSMARRLKKSSHRMLSSVRKDMNRSASLRESGFY